MSKETLKKHQQVFEKTYVQGKTKIRYLEVDKSRHLHVNFGKYKKGKGGTDVDTHTVYNSIYEKDKGYCEVWLDKQKGVPIGVEIMWDAK